ncbi:MAG: GNAT family N-acetyltransferase [Rhizobiales bacterium]|nr:GNAT family N-acetyltransferase [Hyphomicrobiales bacterium]
MTSAAADIAIRDARPGDRAALAVLALEANAWEGRFHHNRDRSPFVADAMVDVGFSYADERDGRFIVAEVRGEVVGSCAFAVVDPGDAYLTDYDRHYGFIAEVTVRESHRGRGIGSALIAEAERWLAAQGVSQLQIIALVGNRPAIRLYERLGFRPYEIALEKRLDGRPVGIQSAEGPSYDQTQPSG